MPPATTTSASPARISAAASMIALSPEPQTRLMVVADVVSGRPAARAAWRAGAWPTPAWRTWPIRTSWTGASAGSPERFMAARMATPPSSVAGTVERAPPKRPIGVRAAETM
jgi:S1-C subfamily serine protease